MADPSEEKTNRPVLDWTHPAVVPGSAYSIWYRREQRIHNVSVDPFGQVVSDKQIVDPKIFPD